MNCFYHPEAAAVGICKSCSRGICSSCVVEFPEGLACKNRCEAEVQRLIALIKRNEKFSAALAKNAPGNRVMMMGLGIFIALFGILFIWASFLGDKPIWVLLGLGLLFASYGVFMVVRAYKFRLFQ